MRRLALVQGSGFAFTHAAWLQVASTIIAAVGFNGYPWPPQGVNNCQFCQMSTGQHHPIFSRQAPLFGTESAWTDSTIGCLCARPPLPPAPADTLPWLQQ